MKKLKKLIAMILAATTILTCVGCDNKMITSIDKSKTQIYVYYYAGDISSEWLDTAVADYNAVNDTYQVIAVPTVNEYYADLLVANGGEAHAFVMTSSATEKMVDDGDIVDLSDILEKDVDGNGVKIKDKMNNVEQFKKFYSTVKNKGLYAIPMSACPHGLIFDYQLFEEKGWLIYQKDPQGQNLRDENNKLIPSVGHDGKAGTYDDGQPITEAEWEEMMERISYDSGSKAFLYTTKYDYYLEYILDILIAQFGGERAYNAYNNWNGSYYDENGEIVNVALNEGSKVLDMPALDQAISFLSKWMVKNEKYVHKLSWDTTETSHKDAQQTFVTGFMKDVQQAAFLVDGSFWEQGNLAYFNLLEGRGYTDRGYGDRDFRFMLFPRFNEYSDQSYLVSSVYSAMIVSASETTSQKDMQTVEATKDFVAFTLKDKYLQLYTLCAGAPRPFNYSLTKEQKERLTPFQQHTLDMLNDTENINLITDISLVDNNPRLTGEISFSIGAWKYAADINGNIYNRALGALRRNSAENYIAGIRKYRKNNVWASATFN